MKLSSDNNLRDADGRKLRTVHVVAYDPVMLPSGETITPTDTLVRDYSGGHIYENGVLERTLTPTGYYASADSKYCYYIRLFAQPHLQELFLYAVIIENVYYFYKFPFFFI